MSGNVWWWKRVNWTDQFCFCSAANRERAAGAAESKCQMRSCLCLGAATLRFFLLKRFFPAFSFSTCNYRFFGCLNRSNCWAIPPSLCILVSQYAPLSLRPLTCEVKAGHRWGPREQGCIQFQRPRTRVTFCEERYNLMNILLPRKSNCDVWCLASLAILFNARKTLRRLWCHVECISVSSWLFTCHVMIKTCQVGKEEEENPSSCSTHTISGGQPYWLALCYSPLWGANRKTAEGCDPVIYVTFKNQRCLYITYMFLYLYWKCCSVLTSECQ